MIKIIFILLVINFYFISCFFKQDINYYGVIKKDNKDFIIKPLNYNFYNETIIIKISSFEISSSSRINIKQLLFDLDNNYNNTINNNNEKFIIILYGNIVQSKFNNNHKFNIIRLYHYLDQGDNNLMYNNFYKNKKLNFYYLIKTCLSDHNNKNSCKKYSINLIEINIFSSNEIKSNIILKDNYSSKEIPAFDDKWFEKKLFDQENQRLIVQGYFNDGDNENKESFHIVNSFIHLPDPYKTCQNKSNTMIYCSYGHFPFYVRDDDRCLHFKACIPLGVCNSIKKPKCIKGFRLVSYRGHSNGCMIYYCDSVLVDQVYSN